MRTIASWAPGQVCRYLLIKSTIKRGGQSREQGVGVTGTGRAGDVLYRQQENNHLDLSCISCMTSFGSHLFHIVKLKENHSGCYEHQCSVL